VVSVAKGTYGLVRFPNGHVHLVVVAHVEADGACMRVRQVRDGRVERAEHRMMHGKDGSYRTPVVEGVFEVATKCPSCDAPVKGETLVQRGTVGPVVCRACGGAP
jgi:hypothetical protein